MEHLILYEPLPIDIGAPLKEITYRVNILLSVAYINDKKHTDQSQPSTLE